MASQFLLLMVGLVFALINFQIGRFEILPDFIGYLLIGLSSHNLSQYTAKFRIARNIALPLLILSVLRYFLAPRGAEILFLINSILEISLIWFVLAAAIKFSRERERPDLAENGLKYRRIYVAIAVVDFLFRVAGYFQPESAQGFIALMSIAFVIVLGLILHLFYVIREDIALKIDGMIFPNH